MITFQDNINNLYALYRKVLTRFDKYGHAECFDFPADQSFAWPSFIFSESWNTDLDNRLSYIGRLIKEKNLTSFFIIPQNEGHISLEYFGKYGFIPVTIWYGMNCCCSEYHRELSVGSIKQVKSESEKEIFLSIINDCHFKKQPLDLHLINEILAIDGITAFVFVHDEKAVSACLCHQHDNTIGIYMVSTLPGYRGKGFASNMISQIAQVVDKPLILQATIASRNVYQRIGFETVGEYIILGLKK
jgi:GNAT superfamily N-acetyltransferase